MAGGYSTGFSVSREDQVLYNRTKLTVTLQASCTKTYWQSFGAQGYVNVGTASAGTTGRAWTQGGGPPWHPGFPSKPSTINVSPAIVVYVNHNASGRGIISCYGIWGTNSNPAYTVAEGYEVGMPPAATSFTWSTDNGYLPDYARVPLWAQPPAAQITPTPTVTRLASGTTDYIDLLSPLAYPDGGVAVFPTITRYQYRMSATTAKDIDKATWYDLVDANTVKNIRLGRITSLDRAKTYYFQTRAVNSEGASVPSATRTAFPSPVFQNVQQPQGLITTIPPLGSPTKSYTGKVTATGVNPTNPYSISSGSLPNGIQLNAASGQIYGTPTLAGSYDFQITAAGPGGSIESEPQNVLVSAAGPWLKKAPVDKAITEATVTISGTVATATIKAVAHGITYYNQPIVISGITGDFDFLNGTFSVITRTTDTVSFIVNSDIQWPTDTVTGTLRYEYMPTIVKVRQADKWLQAYIRVYDTSYTATDGTHWRPTF